MDGFLMDYTQEFIAEAHKPLGEQDTKKAGKLKEGIHSAYAIPDEAGREATQEGYGGLQWSNDIDVLWLTSVQGAFGPKNTSGYLPAQVAGLPLPYLSSLILRFLVSLPLLSHLQAVLAGLSPLRICVSRRSSYSREQQVPTSQRTFQSTSPPT